MAQPARKNAIRIIDKASMQGIQFRMLDVAQAEIVLIDDARANRIAWEAQAKQANRKISTFATGEDFLRQEKQFSRSTPIYVDYFFDGKATGESIAARLVGAGFVKVSIATAYPKERINLPPGVLGIVGKEFPSVV